MSDENQTLDWTNDMTAEGFAKDAYEALMTCGDCGELHTKGGKTGRGTRQGKPAFIVIYTCEHCGMTQLSGITPEP